MPATWTVGGHKQSQDPTDEAEVVAVDAKRAAAFVVNTLTKQQGLDLEKKIMGYN